jgi:putative alpha-1,2-mannosidase
MVKVGPDMESWDGRASGFGYWTDGKIVGFSQTHLSGAQGKYGNIRVMPVTGPFVLGDVASPRQQEVNHPGYYATTLNRWNTRVELTATRRVALNRYTFANAGEAHISVDIQHCLDKGARARRASTSSAAKSTSSRIARSRASDATPAAGTRAANTGSTSP